MFDNYEFEWNDVWMVLLGLTASAILVFAGYGLTQDHTVQFYYLSDHGSSAGRNGYCIDGYRNWWANDSGVFCSDDIQKTIGVLKELNDGMHKGGGSK